MLTYYGYGLRICSELRLLGFATGKLPGAPQVQVRRRAIPETEWPALNDDGMNLAGIARGVMRFRVNEGREITVDPLPEADLDYVRAIISGELMSALLRQRGLLALHASCVAKDGEAIGFVGYSGWGKSTLATRFVERGYQLVCDDVLAIDVAPERPAVIPGYPQVKLRDDSGHRSAEGFDRLPTAHSETDKRLLALTDHFADAQASLRALYLLEGQGRNSSQVVPLGSSQALVELIGHTRATKLLTQDGFQRAHLEQVTALLKSVSVKLLERRKSLDLVPAVCDLVEEDLRKTDKERTDLAAG